MKWIAQTVVTAQNMLSEHKSYHTLHFATVGDPETDAIIGVLAVMNCCGLHRSEAARIMEYLKRRFGAPTIVSGGDWGAEMATLEAQMREASLSPPNAPSAGTTGVPYPPV